MSKCALLVGVSNYPPGLNALPSAIRDGEAMQTVLQSPEIGKFDEANLITDPNTLQMQEAIETLFSGRKKDDLVVLFFSGHGIKDNSGKLYLATSITKKTERGELVKSTAVPASFIHDIMKDSRCKRKVVILDCCFSGAFAHGLSAKDDGAIDIKSQLGGEGCAILTSSTSLQYSFEQQGADLSIYTRYLLEGMETGAADLGNDGYISVDELHEYAQSKVHEESPSMNPKIYAIEEGYKIQLMEAVAPDPLIKYQRAVEQCAVAGEISPVWRITLDEMRANLKIAPEDADLIETRVLRPYREYRKKLKRYEAAFKSAIQQRGLPIQEPVRAALNQLQRTLALRNEDILAIEEKWERRAESQLSQLPTAPPSQKISQRPSHPPANPPVASPAPPGTPVPKSIQPTSESSSESTVEGSTELFPASVSVPSSAMQSNRSTNQPTKNRVLLAVSIAAIAIGSGAGILVWALNQPPSDSPRRLQPLLARNLLGVLGNATQQIPLPVRSPAEILAASPEVMTAEECQSLRSAYESGDTTVMEALTGNPDDTAWGQRCTALAVTIPPREIPPRPIADILDGSPARLTAEECQILRDAYDSDDPAIAGALTPNPDNTAIGQQCAALGESIPPKPIPPRTIADILYGPLDSITSEECRLLSNAYTNGNPEVENALTTDPNNSLVGLQCRDLGVVIPARVIEVPILEKPPEMLTREDCDWLREQYNSRNVDVERLLGTDPAATVHGQRCIELGAEI
jgi:hypothetical protein